MQFFLLYAAIEIAVLVHVGAMALWAHGLGVTVRHLTFGIGPELFKLGLVRVAAIPIGGKVRVAVVDDFMDGEPDAGAVERQPGWQRILISLSGPFTLLALSYALLDASAVQHFTEGFAQVLGGAIAPFGYAQTLLEQLVERVGRSGLATLVGLVACKFAALNLIPFVGSNGAQALLNLLPARLVQAPTVQRAYALLTLPVTLVLLGGWLLAITAFFLAKT